jgi:hypothetical protein
MLINNKFRYQVFAKNNMLQTILISINIRKLLIHPITMYKLLKKIILIKAKRLRLQQNNELSKKQLFRKV